MHCTQDGWVLWGRWCDGREFCDSDCQFCSSSAVTMGGGGPLLVQTRLYCSCNSFIYQSGQASD